MTKGSETVDPTIVEIPAPTTPNLIIKGIIEIAKPRVLINVISVTNSCLLTAKKTVNDGLIKALITPYIDKTLRIGTASNQLSPKTSRIISFEKKNIIKPKGITSADTVNIVFRNAFFNLLLSLDIFV